MAEVVGGEVHITWATLSELNSDRFVVERADEGNDFAAIGELPAQGHSQARTDYTYTDRSPRSGVNRYRLRKLDLDGTVTLSEVVSAVVQREVELLLSPNPAHEEVRLSFSARSPGVHHWQLLDAAGRLQAEGGHTLDAGPASLVVPLGNVRSGAYELVVRDPQGIPTGHARLLVR
jgi:hypothetical protein